VEKGHLGTARAARDRNVSVSAPARPRERTALSTRAVCRLAAHWDTESAAARERVRTIAALWATRDFPQDRRLARLGPGARWAALFWAAHPCPRVWLTSGLRPVGHRDEAWLKRGLPSS